LAVTSAERLYRGWRSAQRRRARGEAGARAVIEELLRPLSRDGALITVLDGHPATLSWIGAVAGHAVRPLGVDRFGQCGDVRELYRAYGIDVAAIEAAFRNP
jgi:pyruvate dehydrogenase E1 component